MFELNERTNLKKLNSKNSDTKKLNSNINNGQRSVLSITSPTKLNIIASLNGGDTDKSHAIDWKKLNKSRVNKQSISLPRSKSLNLTSQKNLISKLYTQNKNNGSPTNSNQSSPKKSLFERPKLNINGGVSAPQLLKRNSSFFKDELKMSTPSLSLSRSPSFSNNNTSGTGSNSINKYIDDVEDLLPVRTDRFIPLYQSNSQIKIDPESLHEELPPPTASPTEHLRAQTKIVFKENVAQACGLKMKQRILEYLPPPPVASFDRQSYSMKKRTAYNFSQQQQQDGSIPREFIKLRKIDTSPDRILDAPGFRDDFYLNLMSWSSKNLLALALDTCLYIWNASTSEVNLLVDYKTIKISSVIWSDDEIHVAVGKDDGNTEIWDTESMKLVRTMKSNLGVRIASLSWLDALIATGSRSGEIQINDVRIKDHLVATWDDHEAEVCGLSYKSDGLQLASGANDNTVRIWDTRTSQAMWVKRTHKAAVKALSWCPYMNNVLATGGGQLDKHIHFWNTMVGSKLGSINTGSQVSSLNWGQSYNTNGTINREIVATGGAPDNAVIVYNYDTKFKVGEIVKAHDTRISCAQLSPDGTRLATIGGDENLKFYKVFEPRRRMGRASKSSLPIDNINLLRPSIPGPNGNLMNESGLENELDRNNDSSARSSSQSYFIR
ncbi:ubiquitin-protein transferase activating protein [Monosporozyma unispora]|nr:ubiquitin-protein transferase activating protein [Kazachstania unispora]